MIKIIAVPVDEIGKLENHFGHCTTFEFFVTEDNQITSQQKLFPPPHAPGVIPKWLIEQKVTDVIVGGIGEKAAKILEHYNVSVFKGAPTVEAKALVFGFLNQTITFSNENCKHKHHEHHEHDHHHNHRQTANDLKIKI